MANEREVGSILALDASLYLIRCALLEPVDGAHRLVGWADGRREAEQPLLPQISALVQQLGDKLGRPLWQSPDALGPSAVDGDAATPITPALASSLTYGAPLLASDDATRTPALAYVSATASLRAPLRVVAVTLTLTSAEAVQRAIQSSPADVVRTLTLSAQTRVSDVAAALVEAQAEVVVVAGGYDLNMGDPADASASASRDGADAADRADGGGALAPPLLLCQTLRRALERLSPGQRPPLLYAGSSFYAAKGVALLQQAGDGVAVEQVANVQPEVGQLRGVPLSTALSRAYWRACRRHPAFDGLRSWTTPPGQRGGQIISHGQGFAAVVQAWRARENLPELHALYAAPDRWLHVLATVDQPGVRLVYARPGERPVALLGWPALRLVSGPWPEEWWPRPRRVWWDRSGMVPMIASVGQTFPRAMMSVLSQDLLRVRER